MNLLENKHRESLLAQTFALAKVKPQLLSQLSDLLRFALQNWIPRSWRICPRLVLGLLLALTSAAFLPIALSQTTLKTPASPNAGGDSQCGQRGCAADPGSEANPDIDEELDENGKVKSYTPQLSSDDSPNNLSPDPSRGGQPYLNRTLERRATPPEKVAEPPTEFQQFVATSVGRRLPLYGHDLFEHVPTTFAPLDRVPVTGDYLIGPGDEILVRAWGQIDLNAKLVVDREGQVFLPKVGNLSVAGLKYEQLAEHFRTAIGRVFRNFDVTVSLGHLRSIQIFVVGQARRPGTYTVSSLCTLVNALFASGGPSNSGSMRHIQLKRENRLLVEFDFYDLLLHGDKANDARLLPGDVIYIPPVGPSVAISGSVNAPGIYELRGASSLSSAIEMASGFTVTADGGKAVVERIDHHDGRLVDEFMLDASGLNRVLQDGDAVRIFPLSPRFRNAVTLRGNVARPGRVEWHEGMRVRDVIPNQEALITREYWRAANSPGNGKLLNREQRLDTLNSQPEIRRRATEVVDASITAPPPVAKLRDEIARDAPEVNWDYAVIQRLNPDDLTTRLIPFNLGKLVLEGDEASNLALQPGDMITIFSQNDLAVPLAKRSKFVRLEGEFRAAGIYRAEPGETLRHLVERVGGFTPNAYLYGAEFTRESVQREQQKGLDALVDNLEQDLTHSALSPSGVSSDDAADRRARLEAQRQMVDKLREIKASGRIVLDLKPDSNSAASLPEISVEDGDRFVVPYRPSTVEVLGAVYNKNSFLYRTTGRVEDYLRRAGGPTREADTSRMFVIRADGSIVSRQSIKGFWDGGFASLRLTPGDAIVIPERLSHGAFLRGLRDWSQVFSQFALGAAAIRVIQ